MLLRITACGGKKTVSNNTFSPVVTHFFFINLHLKRLSQDSKPYVAIHH